MELELWSTATATHGLIFLFIFAYTRLQPQSQKAMFPPKSEQEWVMYQRVRSLHRRLCLHHHHPRLAAALNSGAANVAIAAKPNWSWFSKSLVPVAVVR